MLMMINATAIAMMTVLVMSINDVAEGGDRMMIMSLYTIIIIILIDRID